MRKKFYKPPIDDDEIIEIYQALNAYLNNEPKKILLKAQTPSGFSLPNDDNLKMMVESRLRIIEKYRITNKEMIKRFLSTIFIAQEKITKRDLETLEFIVNNPTAKSRDLAKYLGVNYRTARAYVNRLSNKYRLRFYSLIDPTIFKLRHFVLFLTIPREAVSFVKNVLWTPFTLTINLDTFAVYERKIDGWVTFAIPNQVSVIERFKRWIVNLFRFRLITDYELQEIREITYGMNFFLFEGRDWNLDVHKDIVSSYSFMKDHYEFLQRPEFLKYSFEKRFFTKKEFIVYTLSTFDIRAPIRQLKEIIKRNFNLNVSEATICRIKKKYRKYYYPVVRVNNIMLDGSLMVYIEPFKDSEDDMEVFIRYFSNSYPLYYLAKTTDGIISFIEIPSTKLATIAYHLDAILRDNVAAYKLIPRYVNIGRRPITILAPYWDENRQYWKVPKETFSTKVTIEEI
ncbi:MAG: hypothetical protein J7L07_06325 [Candidatus Odinarchaeota archaeon]|nr:hypothetical protein [Candidatus Odinarchaeota archaeon]